MDCIRRIPTLCHWSYTLRPRGIRLPWLLAAVLGLVTAIQVQAVEIKTADGLALRFDDRTGRMTAVTIAGQEYGCRDSGPALCVRQCNPAAEPVNLVANPDFEAGDAHPTAWKLGPRTARVERDGHPQPGRYCLKISAPAGADAASPGTSASVQSDTIAAHPNRTYRCRAWGMVAPGGSGGSLYVKELDAQGRTLYENQRVVQHSISWRDAPRGVWSEKEASFVTRCDCAQLQVYANIWKGHGDLSLDDIALTDREAWWQTLDVPDAPLKVETGPGTWSQRFEMDQRTLVCEVRYRAAKDHIRIETTVEDASQPRRERALQVEYLVPLTLLGWTWHDDGRRSRALAAQGPVLENSMELAGARASRYPLASVTQGQQGLTLATPLDEPRMQRFAADPARGYLTSVDLGLSPHTKRIGPSRATFVTLLYAHDGKWGFRAAAQKYYEIFPQHFVKRAKRDGTWFYAVRMSGVPRPEDFGARFYEGFPRSTEERAATRAAGILLLPYTEPWGLRQVFAEAVNREDLPPLEERLKLVGQWAQEQGSTVLWRNGPRAEIAQAVLNSLPHGPDGMPCGWRVDKYSQWAQWWITNPSPDLPGPNRARTCKQYEIDPVLGEADGIYLDSVTPWLGSYLNYRREHLACSAYPPVVDRATGRPALLGALSQTEFMAWLAEDLHRQGKLVHMNLFAGAYRFCVHLGDILGSEVGTFGHRHRDACEPDADALLRRTLAYQKPTTNLLQEGNYRQPVPELTHEQVVDYLKQELFYGFYPGIATIGGEEKPGYTGWKRYFGTPAQYERDREAFKQVIAVLDELTAAGWEPIPHARTSTDEVWLERFGNWRSKRVFYTLRNPGQAVQKVKVTVEAAGLGAAAADLRAATLYEMMSQTAIEAAPRAADGALQFTLRLAPKDTAVVRIERRPHPSL